MTTHGTTVIYSNKMVFYLVSNRNRVCILKHFGLSRVSQSVEESATAITITIPPFQGEDVSNPRCPGIEVHQTYLCPCSVRNECFPQFPRYELRVQTSANLPLVPHP